MVLQFQSTHPVWDGTRCRCRSTWSANDFNPPIPCGMGRLSGAAGRRAARISIHPSRVGWDLQKHIPKDWRRRFQSTHPVWDGTWLASWGYPAPPYFNPPIPCGMGLRPRLEPRQGSRISIHPSRVGWDDKTSSIVPRSSQFQSTHPVWDGTQMSLAPAPQRRRFQSTHPVWDGTSVGGAVASAFVYFNPPIPCGMGPARFTTCLRISNFNPPIPCGMGRVRRNHTQYPDFISIHPSRVGWDHATASRKWRNVYFNPPIPCGMGLPIPLHDGDGVKISIHPSRVGWDAEQYCRCSPEPRFQSTHPVWDGTNSGRGDRTVHWISIHPSRVGWDNC